MKVLSSMILLAVLSGAVATGSAVKSPVEKVVKLLEELKSNLEKDEKAEQQIYDRYACWCETASGAKAAAIVIANSEIFKLTQRVLELKGEVAVLSKEIADLTGKMAENEGSQKDSTNVRQKENAAYSAEKAELETAINALERAITVLAKATSFMQGKNKNAVSEAVRKQAMVSVLETLPTRVDPKQLAAIQSFAREFQSDTSSQPASATVQGILKDMYDTFTADLESNTNTEAGKQRDYEDLMAELSKELAHMTGLVAKNEELKAAAAQELADTIQELDDTKATMDADIEFFDQVKAACKAKHEEWTIRSEGRMTEIKGIKEALKILTSDEARALFANAIKPGMETMFLQMDSDASSTAQAEKKAYDALKAAARKAHSIRLAALSAEVRSLSGSGSGGHFDAVIKKIDDIIQELKDEEKKDIKDRDWCKDEYQKNSEEHSQVKWLIETNEAKITKLDNIILGLSEDIAITIDEISSTEKNIAQMEDERKEEHEAFQQAKSDDTAAIALLEKAVEVLGATAQSLLQKLRGPEFEVSQWQAPEAKFSSTDSRAGESKGIVSILTMLIEDLEMEIKNGVKDEIAAQTEFEKQVAAAYKLIADLTTKKENLESDKAKTEEEKAAEEEDKKENEGTLANNEEYYRSIQPDCDWMLNSFQERKEKRKAEMNGLVAAKEALAASFVQEKKSFDDHKLDQVSFMSLQ